MTHPTTTLDAAIAPHEVCYAYRMKVFFCHASEDKPVAEQVFGRVAESFPDVKGWLDKYEIVAGQDLIDKIAEGIESSDKFLIFLSEASIQKPWVQAELKKALMAEIDGVKPDFIIPVKLGSISKFPAFIESKRYIDLVRLTEEEWLREMEAAIRGVSHDAAAAVEDNLEVWVEPVPGTPDSVAVVFRARYWAEQIRFFVTTNAPILERNFDYVEAAPATPGVQMRNYIGVSEMSRTDPPGYAVSIGQPRLSGDDLFKMVMKFPPSTDLNSVITAVGRM